VKPAEDDQGKGDADHVPVLRLLSVYLAFAFPVAGDQQSDAPDVGVTENRVYCVC
jgi:hypothetical protein